ncbi:MAG: tripartite tricarboxylate transporter TctB family protein [Bacillota bacterium]|nr:tripartite tricarboxylate transporter TctB family protein [Bacillota bacterium]
MKSDVKAGITALIISLIYLAATFSSSGRNMVISTPIEPTFFPRLIAGGLIISSLAILIPALIKQKQEGNVKEVKQEPFFTKERNIILGAFIIYVALFNVLGYKIATLLFSIATLTFLNKEAWKRNVTFSVIFVIAAYYVFNTILQVQLPTGFLNI